MLLSRVLTRAAFTVYAVENGELACQTVRLRRPDVVLLDWMMPVMDGCRAAEVLKADAGTRAIPIVMLSTHSHPKDRLAALKAGVQEFLIKPCNAGELLASIDRLMHRSAPAQVSDGKAAHSAAGAFGAAGAVSGPIQTVCTFMNSRIPK